MAKKGTLSEEMAKALKSDETKQLIANDCEIIVGKLKRWIYSGSEQLTLKKVSDAILIHTKLDINQHLK